MRSRKKIQTGATVVKQGTGLQEKWLRASVQEKSLLQNQKIYVAVRQRTCTADMWSIESASAAWNRQLQFHEKNGYTYRLVHIRL
ncbi:hypothetical protein TNCV_2490981 [Trichonephila clavipes]|nr:hypothetical protein TNCV_2490981 [Trichonephila clavipes]